MSESLQRQPPEAGDSSAGFSADLSAWMDGELSGARARLAYRGMMADESRRAQWARYHLIGDVLRGSLPDHGLVDISAAVMARLDDLPAQATTGSRLMRNPRLWGLAASLMLAAIIVANPWHQQEGRQGAVQVAQQESVPGNGASSSSGKSDVGEDDAQARLESYLRNHSQALADAGEGARMLPYLSMAEYTIDPGAASSP
ncbi:MAG: sigma-E factor negative regulatory protein [Candidatus Macondimonas sp.]